MKISKRWEEITIWQGDDLMRIRELATIARDLAREASGKTALMGGSAEAGAAQKAAEEHDEFVEAAKERAVVIRIEELGAARWRALMNEHPPRPGVELDAKVGISEATFPTALVEESITFPEMTAAERTEFVGSLNAGVFDAVYMSAFALNRADGGSPKASLASELTRRNAEQQK